MHPPRIRGTGPVLHVSEEAVETEAPPENGWVNFSNSPFDGEAEHDTPFDETPKSEPRGMASVEMIQGAPPGSPKMQPPSSTVSRRLARAREVTAVYVPPVPPPHAFTASWYESRPVRAPQPPPTPVVQPPTPVEDRYFKDMELAVQSWDQTDPSPSQGEDNYDDEDIYAKPFLKRCLIPRRCVWLLLAGTVIFFIFFLGLMIGAVIRGESLSLSNTFSPEEDRTSVTTVSPSPTAGPTSAPTFLGPPPSNLTVGAYYYPWHGDNFHNGQGYLRKDLNQGPLLGEYNDTDPQVIAQHLSWSRRANIRLWITSWWGPNRLEDNNIRNVILNHRDIGDHKIALMYETSGRIKEGDTKNVADDIEYICQTYFDHPNYYRINGRPVLFVYLTRKLETMGKMEEVILLMRSVADFYGHDLYLVGDHVFQGAPTGEDLFRPFLYLDAVTNYDVYGSMGKRGYAGQDGVDKYYQDQNQWRHQAGWKKCGYIPAVSPGYNDRGVRLKADHAPLSRRLAWDSAPGSLFEAALRSARYLVDDSVDNLLVVNSFNEWHEDTQIEPAVGAPTDEPFNLTTGLEYSGYGELYLDILRTETIDEGVKEEFEPATVVVDPETVVVDLETVVVAP
jgi:glycoprotein endo-alpha-1,2-mannosidase